MFDFYDICYFSAFSQQYLMVLILYAFAWEKWKKDPGAGHYTQNLFRQEEWQGYGNSYCQKFKTGSKRKLAALFKWKNAGMAPGISVHCQIERCQRLARKA